MVDCSHEYMDITCKITGYSCGGDCDCGDCWVAEENCDMSLIYEDEFMDIRCDITNDFCDLSNDCKNCDIAIENEKKEEIENWIFSLEWVNPVKFVDAEIPYHVNKANTIAKYSSVEDAVALLRGNRWKTGHFKKYFLKEEIPNLDKRYPEWWKYKNWYHVHNIDYYLYDDPMNVLIVVADGDVYGIAPKIEADEY